MSSPFPTGRLHQSEMIAKLHAKLRYERLEDHIERVWQMVNFKILKTPGSRSLRTLLQDSQKRKRSAPRGKVYYFIGCIPHEYTVVLDQSRT